MDKPIGTNTTILLPLDGSALAEQALPYARFLAAANAQITLFHVLSPSEPIRDPIGGVAVTADVVHAKREKSARAYLANIAEQFQGFRPDILVDREIAVGDPADEILRVATELGVNLVAMVSHGRSDDSTQAYSSVIDRVTRSTDIATLIIHPTGDSNAGIQDGIHRLVVPLDGSATSAQALPVVEQLARRLSLPIRLVTVLDSMDDVPPTEIYRVSAHRPSYEYVRAQRGLKTRQTLEQTGARLMRAGIPATWEVLVGPVVPRIAETTRPGDLVVMTSHGQSSNARWQLGGTAEALTRRCTAPVLLLRAQIDESTGTKPTANQSASPSRALDSPCEVATA
jgi:nucleotide-binding universal stress UspA family protein